ncbi:Flp pilus assembly protein RcpC/CpaB [Micromonospora kangleipakensis]|uniref:Flp pilus assembly protein RcpC/CpaB n=1 Tax=Micromonospora kangleipakensis TaxID=1077942 RepID=A0A4Q8B5M4_9ACTN|nr:RcpC/CpaB family pilus assembly protein [Micromonospora kangleipakensis]RZU72315.1 Flp pilus assembly protein RcpC/CpaB [Micromonospora kangleipakensis]
MARRIIPVLISVVLAALGTGAVLLYLRSADDRALAGKQARTVLVADKQIPAGTSGRALRTKGYLREVRMPVETLPEDALEQVSGSLDALVTTAPVQRGQLMLRAMFGSAVTNGSGLAIPDGQMAITARVKSAVFGPASLRAGARVAIFYTYTPMDDQKRDVVSGSGLEKGHKTNSVTRLLMTDVEVISVGPAPAADGATVADRTGGGSQDELSVTFGLNQVDAERLAHAVALGGELNVGVLGESSDVKPDSGVDNRSLFE